VHSTKFLIIVKKIVCNFGRYPIFHCFFLLRSDSRSVPFCVLLVLFFLLSSNSGLHRSFWFAGSVWINACCFWPLFLCLWCFICCLIPFSCNLLLPVIILLDLSNSFFDNLKCLFDFKVIHVFVIVEFVSKFKEVVNFTFFIFFLLGWSRCPCRFWSFFSSQFALLTLLTWLVHLLL